MARIPSTFAPIVADEDVLKLCNQIVPGAVPVLVPIRPWSESVPSECYRNVQKYVEKHGGERILGWRPMRWANIVVEAEAHAIWKSPTGELLDITPFDQTASLFLPAPTMKYAGYGHANIRKALTASPLIAELIALSNQLDMAQTSVKAGERFSIPYASYMRKQEILSILHQTGIGRNNPCPCQSGLKFKHCCGRWN